MFTKQRINVSARIFYIETLHAKINLNSLSDDFKLKLRIDLLRWNFQCEFRIKYLVLAAAFPSGSFSARPPDLLCEFWCHGVMTSLFGNILTSTTMLSICFQYKLLWWLPYIPFRAQNCVTQLWNVQKCTYPKSNFKTFLILQLFDLNPYGADLGKFQPILKSQLFSVSLSSR